MCHDCGGALHYPPLTGCDNPSHLAPKGNTKEARRDRHDVTPNGFVAGEDILAGAVLGVDPATGHLVMVGRGTEPGVDVEALARVLWLTDGYDLDADPNSRTAREARPGYMKMAQAVASSLTAGPSLAAFRQAWLDAHERGDTGNRVRQGMIAAIESVENPDD